jgi:Tol biopolymer transport system component
LRSSLSGRLPSAVCCLLVGCALGFPCAAPACPNGAARSGASAGLPDCRAYELVTPRDTNGTSPVGVDSPFVFSSPKRFSFPPAKALGGSFVYATFGTALPATDGNGTANVYRVERGSDGWTSRLAGPSGAQAAVLAVGGFSSDQGYLAFRVIRFQDRYSGTLAIGPGETSYLQGPTGTFQLVGEGTLPASLDEDGNPNGLTDELDSEVQWVSPHGDHVVFGQSEHPVRLLAESPPEGVKAVYDRSPAGLRLVSVLPGGEPAPSYSSFEGASADGSTIVFRSDKVLYARIDGTRTENLGSGALGAGVSDDGRFVFFVDGAEGVGDLFRYDTHLATTASVSGSGDSQFVNVSLDGSRAYFTSPSRLDGENGLSGAPNVYVWDGGPPHYVATVAPDDLARPVAGPALGLVGLARWVTSSSSSPARNGDVIAETSRVTEDGGVIVFESAANLTGFDSGGQVEIYRYDDSSRSLDCVSCGRLFEPPSAGAALADYELVATGPNAAIGNLSADGETVFFQSDEPLLSNDVNGTTDVYEWREGDLFLISTGRSPEPSQLMGVSADGRDVFFRTAEQLVADAHENGTQAIYDARVGGGFPPPAPPPLPDSCATVFCGGSPLGEAAEPEPASALLAGSPRAKPQRRKPCRRRHHSAHRTKCVRHRARHPHGGRG